MKVISSRNFDIYQKFAPEESREIVTSEVSSAVVDEVTEGIIQVHHVTLLHSSILTSRQPSAEIFLT